MSRTLSFEVYASRADVSVSGPCLAISLENVPLDDITEALHADLTPYDFVAMWPDVGALLDAIGAAAAIEHWGLVDPQ